MIEVKVHPSGRKFQVAEGVSLREVLFQEGVEFACGGKGRCKGCRVKVIEGRWPASEAERRLLSDGELTDGWRLACQGRVNEPLTIEVAQWEMAILGDERPFHFTPGEGLGIAVDLGTTTIAAQLLDLRSGEILSVATALNAQSMHGSDVMTRLDFALHGGAEILKRKIRAQVGGMVDELMQAAPVQGRRLKKVTIVGNSAMHHLFAGLPVESLARDPFAPSSAAAQEFTSDELRWSCSGVRARFLPCLGGFVGSDVLAGIVASGLHESERPVALLDLGTNGEIVVGNRERILVASTAAGPAFEGARISMGMRATAGAISEVDWNEGHLKCGIIGGTEARGLCGSGLVDAVAVGLEHEKIRANGRFANEVQSWPLSGRVSLAQKDVRELQLAKSAIATGLMLLCKEWGIGVGELGAIHLAGAFGNYISERSAQRIGLLPPRTGRIEPAGNTALLGAKLALFQEREREFEEVVEISEHISLNEHTEFQELFVEHLAFPEAG